MNNTRNETIYRKAAIKCLGNALNLREASEILHVSGKIGVATSLLILASEELTKAEIYGEMADGLISIDKSDLGKKYVLDKKILHDHTTKGIHFMGYNFVSAFVKLFGDKNVGIEDAANFYLNAMQRKPPNKNNPISKLTFSKEEYETFATMLKKQEERTKALFGSMDEIKLRGFYVDITTEGIVSPKRMNSEVYDNLKATFNDSLKDHSAAINYGISIPLKEELGKAMEEMIKTQEKPLYSGLKRARTTLGKYENYEKMTKGQAIRLSKLCTENSRSLFEGAQILSKKGKGYDNRGLFGTAMALLALSHEEIVKAIIFGMVSTGYSTISSKPVKGVHPIHPSQITCHSCKNELAAWNDITSFVKAIRLPDGASYEQEVAEIKKILNTPIPKGKDSAFLGMGVPPDKLEIAKRHYEFVSNLWGLKETGLYVFVSEENVQSPASFHPMIYQIVENIVRRLVLTHHTFEDYDDVNLERIPKDLLPKSDEELVPRKCPHKNTKRVMGRIVLYRERLDH